MALRVVIVLFDGFDLIDAGGPYEVFLTASRLLERDGADWPGVAHTGAAHTGAAHTGAAPGYDVVLATPGGRDITAFGGMTLTNLTDSDAITSADIVLVPGTIDIGCALADGQLRDTIERLAAAAPLTASVCTGAFLLARAGLLEGRAATTHWEDVADLAACGETGEVISGVRWVDEGAILTSGGLTSGMHLALHLVARTASVDLAHRTARQLDMDWSEAPDRH